MKEPVIPNFPLGKKIIICSFVIFALISLVYAIVPDEDADGVPDLEDNCSDSINLTDSSGCDCSQKTGCDENWCCKGGEVCIVYNFRAVCVRDTDNDGVFNIEDKCPGTDPDAKADSSGCSCFQKVCDDDNPCTDDSCGNTTIECVFVNDDSNYCGMNKECKDGVCVKTKGKGASEIGNWSYDEKKGETKIYYKHSAHTIKVNFKEPLKDDILILDSTSSIISHGLNEDKTKLTLVVEGDPDVQGITTIRTMQKPISVTIDDVELPEIKEQFSPKHYFWIYLSSFLIIVILFIGLVLSQRKHEDELLLSIKKGERKLEREVDLEAELQLKMYIITNLRRGYTAQQIRNELLKDGWRKEIVDRAFSSLRR